MVKSDDFPLFYSRSELPAPKSTDTVFYTYGWILSFDEVLAGLQPQNDLEPSKSLTGCFAYRWETRGYAEKYGSAWPDLDAVLDPQSCAVVLRIACTWSAETMALIDDEGYRTACWECMGFPVEKRNREGMWFRLPILKVPDGYTYDAAQMPTCRHLAYF